MWEGELNSLIHIAWQVHMCTPNKLYLFPFQWRTEVGGWGCSTPTPQILKALQNRAKLNPIVKIVKNC